MTGNLVLVILILSPFFGSEYYGCSSQFLTVDNIFNLLRTGASNIGIQRSA